MAKLAGVSGALAAGIGRTASKASTVLRIGAVLRVLQTFMLLWLMLSSSDPTAASSNAFVRGLLGFGRIASLSQLDMVSPPAQQYGFMLAACFHWVCAGALLLLRVLHEMREADK